jgi:hypothetical protein
MQLIIMGIFQQQVPYIIYIRMFIQPVYEISTVNNLVRIKFQKIGSKKANGKFPNVMLAYNFHPLTAVNNGKGIL